MAALCYSHGLTVTVTRKPITNTVPEKCEDGWDVSSLAAEGIDQDAISEMIRKVLSSYYEDIHSIVLIKNGKLVLEE